MDVININSRKIRDLILEKEEEEIYAVHKASLLFKSKMRLVQKSIKVNELENKEDWHINWNINFLECSKHAGINMTKINKEIHKLQNFIFPF